MPLVIVTGCKVNFCWTIPLTLNTGCNLNTNLAICQTSFSEFNCIILLFHTPWGKPLAAMDYRGWKRCFKGKESSQQQRRQQWGKWLELTSGAAGERKRERVRLVGQLFSRSAISSVGPKPSFRFSMGASRVWRTVRKPKNWCHPANHDSGGPNRAYIATHGFHVHYTPWFNLLCCSMVPTFKLKYTE